MEIQAIKELKDRQWSEHLLRVTWWSLLGIALAELMIVAVKCLSPATDLWSCLLHYVLFPALVNVLIWSVTYFISLRLIRGLRFLQQSFVYITGVSLICLNFAWTHRAIHVVHIVFLLPVILSLVFIGKKALRFAFVQSVAVCILNLIILFVWAKPFFPQPMEVVMILALLMATGCVCYLVVMRQREITQSLIDASAQSQMDSLTQLYNHATFYAQLDEHILAHARDGGDFCLLVFDIDDFKKVNDDYGHDVGDEVLLALVSAIESSLNEGETAYRYGGEEFTVLTPRSSEASVALAQTIREAFAELAMSIHGGQGVTVSVGVSQYDAQRFHGRREFFASADEALYEAKRTGKNKVVLWNEKLLEWPNRSEIRAARPARK